MPLPCDALCAPADVRADRAISVAAPYSYDILDNFGRRSPRERNPELRHLEIGQRFMTIFALQSFVDG